MFPNKRMLHFKIWQSDQFLSLKPIERLLYIGMITVGDDEGRLRGDAAFFKRVFFFDDHISVEKLEKMTNRIHATGLILKYEANNHWYILHPKWKRYQQLRADRLKPSEIPAPLSDNRQPTDSQSAQVFELGKDSVGQDSLGKVNLGEDSVAIRATEQKKSARELMETARDQTLKKGKKNDDTSQIFENMFHELD